MTVAVAIPRMDLSAAELQMAPAATRNGHVARLLLALALVLEGANRTEAARLCGMDRQLTGACAISRCSRSPV